MSSLQAADRAAAATAVAPRVSVADIEAAIADKFFLSGALLAEASLQHGGVVCALSREQHIDKYPSLDTLTICVVVLKNGWTVIGKSAPVSAANFSAALGHQFAYEDAVRQLWPLMGYALRDKLAAA